MTNDELEAKLNELDAAMMILGTRLAVQSQRCAPELPHPNRVSFMRGPNLYVCECGQVYEKDGKGGLKEIV